MVLKYVKAIIFFGNCTFGHIDGYRDTSPTIGYAYHQEDS